MRAWVSRVLAHEAFRATEAAANGLFKSTDVEVKVSGARKWGLCLTR